MSAPDYRLDPQQIDLWHFPLLPLPLLAIQILDEEEQLRARRFYFARHQRRFILARAMMRVILANYLGKPPATLRFDYNAYGKPDLKDANHIAFNLSHSGEQALLAVGQHFPIGVDLEQMSERPYDDLGLAAFSDKENAALRQADKRHKAEVFFTIWSQKEAFLKATGMGLSYPAVFTVPLATSHKENLIRDPLSNHTWVMHAFKPAPDYFAALCRHPSVMAIRQVSTHPAILLGGYL